MEINCPICKKIFTVKHKAQKFCSYPCARLHRYPKKYKVCEFCKNEFEINSVNKNNRYCCKKCFDKKQSERIIFICKHCKKSFKEIPSRANVRVFCSKKCKYADLAKIRSKMVGEKNPNFIHGNTRSAKYRKIAFEKFPHECAVCKKSNCRLEVHHIDHNEHNNNIKNLMILCCSCHIKHHRGSLELFPK